MKSTLKLNHPLWKTPERRALPDKAVQSSGAEMESLAKQKILSDPKSGKLYRRGAIKKRITQKDLKFYRSNRKVFRRTFASLFNEKTTVGYKFHRASKKGESPATDTGELANSIRAKKIGFMSVRVASSRRLCSAARFGKRFEQTVFRSDGQRIQAEIQTEYFRSDTRKFLKA
ncbi:MAG TPA: hypothetical protein VK308_11330 [Pyrinomonadaceae bacterium]|nr:hypothetical protein [Pyrinomonadaceae bacterium]